MRAFDGVYVEPSFTRGPAEYTRKEAGMAVAMVGTAVTVAVASTVALTGRLPEVVNA
ncbi:hypothetical protein PHLCEN_2v1993 [Hermanssonia centrifuga]|uniref:Uncharacterized protein n=1 Tax=Hermanssonia centrifuga TaxID=98765 RepID=A0A2R6RQD9_9APHY|nr:hypothetical protein PHLCEN_2v1993 [Hermanssonia centrifuga]